MYFCDSLQILRGKFYSDSVQRARIMCVSVRVQSDREWCH